MMCQSEYIGMTRTTLKKRFDAHYYNYNIQKHHNLYHEEKVTNENLYENSIIIEKENDHKKLAVKEALKIIELSPKLNVQFENLSLTLTLYRNKNTKNEKINQIVNHSSTTNNKEA